MRAANFLLLGITAGLTFASPAPKLPPFEGNRDVESEVMAQLKKVNDLKNELVGLAWLMSDVTKKGDVERADNIQKKIREALHDQEVGGERGQPNPGEEPVGIMVYIGQDGRSPDKVADDMIEQLHKHEKSLRDYRSVLLQVKGNDSDEAEAAYYIHEINSAVGSESNWHQPQAPAQPEILVPENDPFYNAIKGSRPPRSTQPVSDANWDIFFGELAGLKCYSLNPWTVPRKPGQGHADPTDPTSSIMSTVEGERLYFLINALPQCRTSGLTFGEGLGARDGWILSQLKKDIDVKKYAGLSKDPLNGLTSWERSAVQLAYCELYELMSPDNPANQQGASGAVIAENAEARRSIVELFEQVFTKKNKRVPEALYPNKELQLDDLFWPAKFVEENHLQVNVKNEEDKGRDRLEAGREKGLEVARQLDNIWGSVKAVISAVVDGKEWPWAIRFWDDVHPNDVEAVSRRLIEFGASSGEEGNAAPYIFFARLALMIEIEEDNYEDAVAADKVRSTAGTKKNIQLSQLDVNALKTLDRIAGERLPQYQKPNGGSAEPFFSIDFGNDAGSWNFLQTLSYQLMKARMELATLNKELDRHPKDGGDTHQVLIKALNAAKDYYRESKKNLINSIVDSLFKPLEAPAAKNYNFFTKKEWDEFVALQERYNLFSGLGERAKLSLDDEFYMTGVITKVFRGFFPERMTSTGGPGVFITRVDQYGKVNSWASSHGGIEWAENAEN